MASRTSHHVRPSKRTVLRQTYALRRFSLPVSPLQDDEKLWEGVYDYLCGAGNHPNLMAVELLEDTDGLVDRFCQAMILPHFRALCYYAQYCGFHGGDLMNYLTLVQTTWPAGT